MENVMTSSISVLLNVLLIIIKALHKVAVKLFRKVVGIESLERRHKLELQEQREELIAALRGDNFDTLEAKIVVPKDVEDLIFKHIVKLYGKDMEFVDEVFNRIKSEYVSIFDRPNFAYDTITLGSDAAIFKLIKYYADKLIKEKISKLNNHDLDEYFKKVAYLNSLYCVTEETKLEVSNSKPSPAVSKIKQAFKLDSLEVDEMIKEAGLDPETIDRSYINALIDKVTKQAAVLFFK